MRCIAVCLVAMFLAGSVAAQSSLEGKVTHLRDGDTIEVEGVAVRSNGMRTPELDKKRRSTVRFMRCLMLGSPVRCDLDGEISCDRLIGTCYLNGRDMARRLVAAVLGRDCPRYSAGPYADADASAAASMPPPGFFRLR